jgi:hypothetical protein
MGIADRARDALRPTNSIEAVQTPEPARITGLHGASPAPLPDPSTPAAREANRADAAKKPAAYTTEPEAISKSFYIEDKGGERRYFDDYQRKSLAMRATNSSISTKREDLNTIKAMLAVAAARGWQSIEIKGTAEFKREAWIEAQARGLDARGYKATDLDRQEADRRRVDRGQANEVRTTPAQAEPTRPAAAGAAATAAAPAAKDAPALAKAEVDKPDYDDNRKALRVVQRELSPDGRLVLAAMSEKIDRQMDRHNSEAKAELKAFVASELVKKERAEGPVVLSSEQKRAAEAPEPARRIEPEAPRLSRGR